VLLAIVFVLELSAGLAAYILKDGLKEYLVSRVNTSMQYYTSDPEIARTIDFMQKKVCYRNFYIEVFLHSSILYFVSHIIKLSLMGVALL